MAVNIGPRIGLEGEGEFRKQLNNINQQVKTLASEMKEVSSRFDDADNSQEKLTAQSKVLTKQIEAQKERIKLLEKGLSAATDKYGEADTKTQKWQQALNEAKTSLNQLERATDSATDGVSKYADAAGRADEGTSLLSSINSAVNFSAIASGFQMVADVVERVVSGCVEIGSTLIEAAATVRAENAQFEQTFAGVEDAATAAIDAVAESSGILATRLQPVASQIYAFAKASGADSSEALELMSDALQAAADSAAFYDTSLEDASESLRSFLKGNFANDAALGVSATETTRNAKAMELFGEKYNDLSEIQKQKTLLKMVTDAQALSGAMGQAARESESWENVTGNLSEAWQQMLAEVGTPLLDAVVPAIKTLGDELSNMDASTITEIVQSVADAITEIVPKIPDIINGVMSFIDATAAIGSFLMEVGKIVNSLDIFSTIVCALIIDVKNFVEEAGGVGEALKAIAEGFYNSFKENLTNVVSIFSEIISSAKTWGADMLQGFIDGIKSKIGALISSIKSIASTIASYLHFSRPDVGPLHQYEQWMPDMMSGLAAGINANAYKVEDAIAAVASKMQVNLNGAVGRSGNITQNISFGYEVQAPDVVAAKIRQQTTYGLAAVM